MLSSARLFFRRASTLSTGNIISEGIPIPSSQSKEPLREWDHILQQVMSRWKHKRPIKPNTLHSLLCATKTHDDYKKVVELIPRMRLKQQDASNVTRLLLARSLRFRDPWTPLRMLQDPQKYGLAPTTADLNAAMIFATHIPAMSESGKSSVTEPIDVSLEVIKVAGLFPVYRQHLDRDSYAILIHATLASAHPQAIARALQLASEAAQKGFQFEAKTHQEVVAALIRDGQMEPALKWIEEHCVEQKDGRALLLRMRALFDLPEHQEKAVSALEVYLNLEKEVGRESALRLPRLSLEYNKLGGRACFLDAVPPFNSYENLLYCLDKLGGIPKPLSELALFSKNNSGLFSHPKFETFF